ncbi:cutinase [Schizophyllum amplum]|uniref:Cutinase n=1 Tax=Schizophyllum amplum TaxID=97359 RepID=A0A550CJT1_9AGAR|nr:cutinase [Auriculariopsis ampla]
MMFTLDTLFTAVGLMGAMAMAVPAAVVRQECASVYLIHAAGTSEDGLGAVGEPLAGNLTAVLPSFASVGLDYDTSAEYVATVAEGAQTMGDLIGNLSSTCPEQKFILSGYSKGAMVVHATDLSDELKGHVCGISVFGDPDDAKGLAAVFGLADVWPILNPVIGVNVAPFCNDGDPICDSGLDIDAHLAYDTDGSVTQAAAVLAAACA